MFFFCVWQIDSGQIPGYPACPVWVDHGIQSDAARIGAVRSTLGNDAAHINDPPSIGLCPEDFRIVSIKYVTMLNCYSSSPICIKFNIESILNSVFPPRKYKESIRINGHIKIIFHLTPDAPQSGHPICIFNIRYRYQYPLIQTPSRT